MASELDVVNEALVKLGANPIASLNDVGAAATAARVTFETVKERLLAETPWYWALKRVQLPEVSLASGEYDEYPDYDHIYQLPSGMIRALGLVDHEPFAILRDRLHTSSDDPVLVYVFEAEVSRWPGYFRSVVVKTLASELAVAVTDITSRAQWWAEQARQERARAMAIDAQQTPPWVFDLMRVYLRQTVNPLAGA